MTNETQCEGRIVNAYSYAQGRALACHARGDLEREREWLDLLHLLDQDGWDCDNFTEPATCLSAGVSETGRCSRCALRLRLARETVRLARDDREGETLRSALIDLLDDSRPGPFTPAGTTQPVIYISDLRAVLAARAARDDREGETVTEAERLALYIEEQARRFIEAGKAMGLPFDMPVRAKHAGYMEAASMVRNAPADWSPVAPDGGDQR